ncbi:terminase small subunit [Enterobacter hormaechei]|uniref:terminase small subunit n=1 Tax=Enterobacter hormaechei TaxID=158836 RepID=UPI0038B24CD3
MAKLRPKQERFCREYIIDLDVTQAAVRAGYSQKTASNIGEENLRKPEIKKRISELIEDRNQCNKNGSASSWRKQYADQLRDVDLTAENPKWPEPPPVVQ